jgi:hypothetical protein
LCPKLVTSQITHYYLELPFPFRQRDAFLQRWTGIEATRKVDFSDTLETDLVGCVRFAARREDEILGPFIVELIAFGLVILFFVVVAVVFGGASAWLG